MTTPSRQGHCLLFLRGYFWNKQLLVVLCCDPHGQVFPSGWDSDMRTEEGTQTPLEVLNQLEVQEEILQLLPFILFHLLGRYTYMCTQRNLSSTGSFPSQGLAMPQPGTPSGSLYFLFIDIYSFLLFGRQRERPVAFRCR